MKPKRILLVRHGESEGNVDPTVYGQKPDYALQLTSLGQEQARCCGVELQKILNGKPAMFYVSPFWRTRETFELLASQLDRALIKYREEPRIREQEWGHLRGMAERDAVMKARDAYGSFYFRIPDGESCADVYDRVTTFLETLHRDFAKTSFPENAVLVTHGMAIRLFLMRWFKWTVEEFEILANPVNCAIVIMELKPNGKYELKTPLGQRPDLTHSYQRPLAFK